MYKRFRTASAAIAVACSAVAGVLGSASAANASISVDTNKIGNCDASCITFFCNSNYGGSRTTIDSGYAGACDVMRAKNSEFGYLPQLNATYNNASVYFRVSGSPSGKCTIWSS
ncbi:hypothetical protein AB0G29_06635 [Streptomyces parvus]|uniref:hypothetical protein n=1 Tax=Streptomyces parvus TaxID=66428 RepID=UPI003409EBF4